MTITLFERRRFRGDSQRVTGNIADLGQTRVDRPGSIQMSAGGDEILLFKNDNWKGGVHYIRGRRNIENLGSSRQGGRNTFGNSVRSVRVTPFSMDLNVTVVRNNDGDLPGTWRTQAEAEREIGRMVRDATAYYTSQQALLRLSLARVTFRTDERRFTMRKRRGIPRDWKERGEVDAIFVDRFEKDDLLGLGSFPHSGKTIIMAGTVNPSSGPDFPNSRDDLTFIMVHELGHYLGLTHRTAGDDSGNLMFPTKSGQLGDKVLTPAQIREMHQKLARNLSRKGDRN